MVRIALRLIHLISADCGLPQRYILAIMGFFAMAIAYTMRVCLSLAITEMVLKPNTTNTSEVKWNVTSRALISGKLKFYSQ